MIIKDTPSVKGVRRHQYTAESYATWCPPYICINVVLRIAVALRVQTNKPILRVAAVAAYITTIYVLERRGLVFGAAAGGAEHVSAYRNTLLPEPRPGKPRDDMCVPLINK